VGERFFFLFFFWPMLGLNIRRSGRIMGDLEMTSPLSLDDSCRVLQAAAPMLALTKAVATYRCRWPPLLAPACGWPTTHDRAFERLVSVREDKD